MKKQLLTLATLAALVPAFNANAEATLTEVWTYQTSDYNADYDFDAPDWTSTDQIKKTSCARVGTGRDGKIYTLDMKTMSILEITAEGVSEYFKLPALEDGDYYGTAISLDEVGNFLIGHYFTQPELSSNVWSIYCPSSGAVKHFDLGYPNDMKPEDYNDGAFTTATGIGRIDVVGRVLGDLTSESLFFIAPFGKGYAQNVRIVYGYGDGDENLETVDLDGTEYIGTYLGSSSGQNIAQPSISNMDEFGTTPEDHYKTFILCSGEGGKWDIFSSRGSQASYCANMQAAWRAQAYPTHNNGFDTFFLNGHRYFVHSYSDGPEETFANNKRPMSVAVFNELGVRIAEWTNLEYASNNGYNSIVAQPQEDGSVLIHAMASCSSMTIGDGKGCISAAVLKFTPESEDEREGSENNPILIATADDLINLPSKCLDGENYIKFAADIDLAEVEYKVPFTEGTASTKTLHIDGDNHVVRNLTGATGVAQNASLFGSFKGSIKNLGIEDIDVNVTWYCTGSFTGVTVGDVTIDNCYATGSVQGAASGGLVGSCNAGKLTITNSYAQVNTADNAGGHSAGLVGRANADLEISHAYASGTVSAKNNAAGLVNVNTAKSVTLTDVIAWNPAVSSESLAGPTVNGDATLNNVLFFKDMTINGEPIDSGADAETLEQTATAWEAYSKTLVDGLPVLAWQKDGGAGINAVEADSSDAPAVYFNLQGIRVANPENGIYIVRRGNKVTKEIIR